jgi:hypothetical protein
VNGIMKLASRKEIKPRIMAERIYGKSNLLKLIPLARIAIISEFPAIREVKKITAINVSR